MVQYVDINIESSVLKPRNSIESSKKLDIQHPHNVFASIP